MKNLFFVQNIHEIFKYSNHILSKQLILFLTQVKYGKKFETIEIWIRVLLVCTQTGFGFFDIGQIQFP